MEIFDQVKSMVENSRWDADEYPKGSRELQNETWESELKGEWVLGGSASCPSLQFYAGI